MLCGLTCLRYEARLLSNRHVFKGVVEFNLRIQRSRCQSSRYQSSRYQSSHCQRLRANMEVLIVEDNLDMQEVLKDSVAELKSVDRVHTAATARAGKQGLMQRKPQLLICDIGLPDGSGVEVISKAAELNILSIVVSVICDEATVLKAVESGANGYLLKDNNPPQIQAAVLEVLDGGAPITPSIATHLLSLSLIHI